MLQRGFSQQRRKGIINMLMSFGTNTFTDQNQIKRDLTQFGGGKAGDDGKDGDSG